MAGFSLQTDLKDQSFINGKLEYKHFIFNCNYDFDLNWYYRKVNFTSFESLTNSFETNFNYRNFRLIAGFSNLNIENQNSDAYRNFSAPLVGLGTWITTSLPVRTFLSGKAAFYKGRTEIIGKASFYTKHFELFVNYYELDSFSEFTIGIGKEFGYFLKSRKQYKPFKNK